MSFPPTSDRKLLEVSASTVTKINSVGGHDGVDSALLGLLTAQQQSFAQKYAVASNEATRTRVSITAKNTAAALLIDTMRKVAHVIQANPNTTDARRVELGLPVRKTPTPIAPPSEQPTLDVVRVVGPLVTVRLHNSAGRAGRPAGAAGARLYYFIGESEPQELSQWQPLADVSRAVNEVTVPDAAPGERVWLMARWFNAKQQDGPLSEPEATRVQWKTKETVVRRGAAALRKAA